jgi:hypothetical protein
MNPTVEILSALFVLTLVPAGFLLGRTSPAARAAAMVASTVMALLAVAVLAVGLAERHWVGVSFSALFFLAAAIQWDALLSVVNGHPRLPRLTLWLIGYRWASSTNRDQPPS